MGIILDSSILIAAERGGEVLGKFSNAPANVTVLSGLLVSALSVSAAILLILELYTPYSGLIQLSNAPLRDALTQLGR
jgi:hypothetical protein